MCIGLIKSYRRFSEKNIKTSILSDFQQFFENNFFELGQNGKWTVDCSYGSRDLSVGTFTFVLGALIAEKGGSPIIFCTELEGLPGSVRCVA